MKFRAIQICLVTLVSFAGAVGVLARAEGAGDVIHSQKIERTVSADSSVTVSICLMSGSITVNGWDKTEVLARSSDAAQIDLRQTGGESGKATKVEVVVLDKSDQPRMKGNCQAYSDLELFVPRGASVHVQTRDGNIEIADIAVAVAGSQNGDISIERVSQAVEVGSVGGSVCIKDSTGRASVTTIGGGIEVENLRPSATADGFEAVSVSGDLNLEGVSHSQFNARTVSGNVHLIGPLATRGRYGFKTMSGDITITMPGNSSFNLNAKISKHGEIISDFPLTLIPDPAPPSPPVPVVAPAGGVPPTNPTPAPPVKPQTSPVIVKVSPRVGKIVVTPSITVTATSTTSRRVTAVCGAGDASIQVASFSGTLHLLKK